MTAAYLSERQWGTVRQDYSPHGTAWDYFPHDHAQLVEENRQRVYTDPEFELVYAPQWSNSSLRVALAGWECIA